MDNVGYLTPNENYFYNAAQYIIQKIGFQNKNIVFVVCTDEVPWAKENLTISKFVKFANQSGKLEGQSLQQMKESVHFEIMEHLPTRDRPLCLLTLADHAIVSVGTYSWWAAFLNRNNFHFANKPILIYFNNPFKPNSVVSHYFSITDHFPSHWIGLGNS